MRKMKVLMMIITGALACAPHLAGAAVPPLREQISLNGAWEQGGQVPDYEGHAFEQRTFGRRVQVPASWQGKRVVLHFGAVNYVAQVFVNDKPVARHVGPWLPFEADITPHAAPGQSFALRVEVQGRTHMPIAAPGWKPLWPIGEARKVPSELSCGIVDDVSLRAYGQVHVADVRIQTSVRDQRLTLDYTLRNADTQARTVQLQAEASHVGGQAGLSSRPVSVTLQAGEEKKARVEEAWANPALWWPDDPQLYHLRTRLTEGAQVVDEETRRFGFREIWVDGARFRLNGVVTNFTGDYVLFGNAKHWPARFFTPQGFPDAVRQIKALNIRIMRFHKRPAPRWALEMCDEMGLAVASESALNGATGGAGQMFSEPTLSQYLENSKTWVADWVKAERNHPSILFWSAMNEMFVLPAARSTPIGAVIDAHDGTRPIFYEGHDNHPKSKVDGTLISLHYPRIVNAENRWNAEPWGTTAADWRQFVRSDKPTTMGEGIYVPASSKPNEEQGRNIWWQGVWTRGMRATGWDYIAPAVFRWVSEQDDSPVNRRRVANLANAFAPVALFDVAYDDAGIAPFVENKLPLLKAGTRVTRALHLFNDEWRGETLEVAVEARVDEGRVVASGTGRFEVARGEYRKLECAFEVPHAASFELVRVVKKDGRERFRESRTFQVEGAQAGRVAGREISLRETAK